MTPEPVGSGVRWGAVMRLAGGGNLHVPRSWCAWFVRWGYGFEVVGSVTGGRAWVPPAVALRPFGGLLLSMATTGRTSAPPRDAREYADRRRALDDDIAAIWTRLPPELRAKFGLDGVRFGSAIALVARSLPTPFFNRLDNLGVYEPASEALLDEALAFQGDQGIPFSVGVHPAAQPHSLADWLAARGLHGVAFRLVSFWRGAEPTPNAPSVRVEEVMPELQKDFVRVVAAGFGLPEETHPVFEESTRLEGFRSYLAFDDNGEPAGGAQLILRGSTAYLASASTLPAYRGHGVQTALLARRINDAIEAGVTDLFVDTAPDSAERPNPSYRNVVRAGFRPVIEVPYFMGAAVVG